VLIESGVTRPHDPYTFTMVFETGLCRRNHGGLDLHWDRSVILRQATNATLLPTSFNSVTRKTISKSGNGLAGGSPNSLTTLVPYRAITSVWYPMVPTHDDFTRNQRS
jgi:hypothetical protein